MGETIAHLYVHDTKDVWIDLTDNDLGKFAHSSRM